MRKYICVQVGFDGEIWATDPSVLDWIFEAVKMHMPKCTKQYELNDFKGERTGFTFKTNANITAVSRGIIKLLCKDGYEPFAVHGDTMYLRRIIEE